ncbi:hypothetical protein GCM10011495_30580 [Hymenobacter frigidus]|uniref:RadC-like JAB domain-containing protein n=1 Tax=Hymenobacter frigidus TaxID=1524095 RepID=A0ABQ2A9M1_9BACT|nr:hypothetical protein [Hymenobacter frigidus]GGH88702.1 hypothetical protein GCM10011495_30580 [Hymenobacter frigidus]
MMLDNELLTQAEYDERRNAILASLLSSRAQVTVVNQKERHSELAEESCRSHPRRPLARARFLGKLGMTFFFIRLLVRGHLRGLSTDYFTQCTTAADTTLLLRAEALLRQARTQFPDSVLNHDNLNLSENFGSRPSLALLGKELYRLISAANGTALVIVDHSCGAADLGGNTISTKLEISPVGGRGNTNTYKRHPAPARKKKVAAPLQSCPAAER